MMDSITGVRVSTLALAIATAAMSGGAASAQDADTKAQVEAGSQAQGTPTTPASGTDDAIVVTGSRIQSSFDRPTPVTILGAERLKDRGLTNVGDALNELPAFRATQTPATSGLNATPGQAIGGRVLDLRGLGAVRTLTLVDGKRFVPATTQATVDTNMVPSIMLSRAEVVTGGASAVYGSDAVAGVVNLLIDKKYTGYKVTGQVGFSNEGDDFTRQFGAEAGWEFGSNLHLVVGGEWEKSDGVDACRQRDWCANGLIIVGRNPYDNAHTPTVPASNILPNANTWSANFNGVTTPPSTAYANRDVPVLRPIDGIGFNSDGTPRRFQFGTLVNSIWMAGGEGGGPAENNPYFDFPIVSPTQRYSTMGYLTWDATPDLTFEVGVTVGQSSGHHRSAGYRSNAITIKSDNPFIPRSSDPTLDIPTILANSGLASFTLGKGFADIGPAQIAVKDNLFRVVTSAKYNIGGSWTADLYYQYGHNKFRSDITNNTITSNITKALDVTTRNGQPICRVNADATAANDDPACVPLDPFGFAQGSTFQAAKNYVTGKGFQTNVTTEHVVAANVAGSLFNLPYGPLGVAFGAEYRNDDVKGDTDPLSKAGRFFNTGNGSVISGQIQVSEVYGEAEIPLLRDVSFARELSLNGAARRTHYNRSSDFHPTTTVNATTWKFGGVWAPIQAIRFRATKSRDIRAPNVSELFGPQTTGSGILTDTGNGGVQVIVPITSGSNPNLRPEKADTFTAGVVLQPQGGFLGRFRASADWYNIKIDDAISTLGQQNIVNRCVAGDALSCSLITRDANKNVLNIQDTIQNVNKLIARGIDFELDYTQPLGGDNKLSFVALANYVKDLITIDSVGPTDRAGQTGLRGGTPPGIPDWTVDATARLDLGESFSLTTHARWINKGFFYPTFVEPGDPGFSLRNPNSVNTNSVPSRIFVDMLATVRLESQWTKALEVYAGVDNILNQDPPRFPGANGSGNNVLFNPVGRFFKMGARMNF